MKQQGSSGIKENGAAEVFPNNKTGKRILIADDDLGIQDIFSIIFRKAGFIIEIKKDGGDLLKNQFTLPDLFLIDKQLSGYNGLDVCRHLKSRKQTKDIPVIMVSASPDIAALSKDAGADNYIEKPFEIKDLLELVNKYVNGNAKMPSDNAASQGLK